MKIILQAEPFDSYAMASAYQVQHLPQGQYGATVSFVGSLRDFNDGQDVTRMTLEHYPGMAERQIEQVCQHAAQQWDLIDILVVHRHGEITPDEAIVLVVVWSAHRADAFDACRHIINYLKQIAPFWKQETGPGGRRWVEVNSADPGAPPANTAR
ncbi:MAG: hypothetical protein A2V90_00145 [Gammaproteobacteria bacterium RBG_16_57_12]|nr:MAG: hypothetical protein A2V90_00145 [Gammaproteobacteria bacterium RBG_16_57_12]